MSIACKICDKIENYFIFIQHWNRVHVLILINVKNIITEQNGHTFNNLFCGRVRDVLKISLMQYCKNNKSAIFGPWDIRRAVFHCVRA